MLFFFVVKENTQNPESSTLELVCADEETDLSFTTLEEFFPIEEIDPDFGAKVVTLFLNNNKDVPRECHGFHIHFEYQGDRLEMFVHLPDIAITKLKDCLSWLRLWQHRLRECQGATVYLEEILEMNKHGYKPAAIADFLNEKLLVNLARYTAEKFIYDHQKSIKIPQNGDSLILKLLNIPFCAQRESLWPQGSHSNALMRFAKKPPPVCSQDL